MRKRQGKLIGKKEVKFSLFANKMVVYVESLWDKKLLELIRVFGKVMGNKVILRNEREMKHFNLLRFCLGGGKEYFISLTQTQS